MVCVENELGKQLHGSVRISNLETSFRLLINGADPNYFHDVRLLHINTIFLFLFFVLKRKKALLLCMLL